MAKFKIHKREGHFGKGNFRNENHGKEKVPAVDFKVKCLGGKRELDMLAPLADGNKISDLLYTKDGQLVAGYLSPLKIHRKPDDVICRIWDSPTNARSVLEFSECTVKDITIELHDKRNIDIEFMIQLHDDPDKHSTRLRRLMDQDRHFELEAQQEDFWDKEPDDEEDETPQGELPVDQEQEKDEDEEPETEEEEEDE